MKRTWLLAALSVLALTIAGPAAAGGDMAAGKAKAKSCAGCHGADGKGKKDNPAIVGLDEATFADLLTAYKTGTKEHKMMNMLSKKLSDKDIADLAAYYVSLK